MAKFHYGPCGSLTTDEWLEGAIDLPESDQAYYGGRYLIGESMSRQMAETLAKALGGELTERPA